MLVSQQNSVPADDGSVSMSALQVRKAGVDHPGEIVCTGPKYQYSYATDSAHVHLSAQEYERVGEKTAQVYFERVVLGHDWQPLQPTSAEVNGNVVTVHFHVPVPPLAWDDALPAPHGTMIPEWAAGRGFEVTAAGVRKTITGVEIIGDDTVQITSANDLSGLAGGRRLRRDRRGRHAARRAARALGPPARLRSVHRRRDRKPRSRTTASPSR